jgi:DNA-binding NtrC family response regulator
LGETPEAPFRIRREEAEPHAKVFAGLLGDQKKLRSENEAREKRPERILELLRKTRFPGVGWSEWFLEFLEGLEQKAKSNEPVLIAGPAGTGRKTAALAVHALSGNAAQPALVYAGEEDAMKILRLAFEGSKSGSVVIDEIEEAQRAFLTELRAYLNARGAKARLIATTKFETPDLLRKSGLLPKDILPRIGNAATNITIAPLRNRSQDAVIIGMRCLNEWNAENGTDYVFDSSLAEALSKIALKDNLHNIRETVRGAAAKRRAWAAKHLKRPAPLGEFVDSGEPKERLSDEGQACWNKELARMSDFLKQAYEANPELDPCRRKSKGKKPATSPFWRPGPFSPTEGQEPRKNAPNLTPLKPDALRYIEKHGGSATQPIYRKWVKEMRTQMRPDVFRPGEQYPYFQTFRGWWSHRPK